MVFRNIHPLRKDGMNEDYLESAEKKYVNSPQIRNTAVKRKKVVYLLCL